MMQPLTRLLFAALISVLSACGGGNSSDTPTENSKPKALDLKEGSVVPMSEKTLNSARYDASNQTVTLTDAPAINKGDVVYSAEQFWEVSSAEAHGSTTVAQVVPANLVTIFETKINENLVNPAVENAELSTDEDFFDAVADLASGKSDADVRERVANTREKRTANKTEITLPFAKFCGRILKTDGVECGLKFELKDKPNRTAAELSLNFKKSGIKIKVGYDPQVHSIVIGEKANAIVEAPIEAVVPIIEITKSAQILGRFFGRFPQLDIPFEIGYVRVKFELNPVLFGDKLKDGINIGASTKFVVNFDKLRESTITDFQLKADVSHLGLTLGKDYAVPAGSTVEINGSARIDAKVNTELFLLPKIPLISGFIERVARIGGATAGISPILPFKLGVCSWVPDDLGPTKREGFGAVELPSVKGSLDIQLFKLAAVSFKRTIYEGNEDNPIWKKEKPKQCLEPFPPKNCVYSVVEDSAVRRTAYLPCYEDDARTIRKSVELVSIDKSATQIVQHDVTLYKNGTYDKLLRVYVVGGKNKIAHSFNITGRGKSRVMDFDESADLINQVDYTRVSSRKIPIEDVISCKRDQNYAEAFRIIRAKDGSVEQKLNQHRLPRDACPSLEEVLSVVPRHQQYPLYRREINE